jgi:hypothetical protein
MAKIVSANARPDADKNKQRANFAAGIARSEFGRFYWDARKERDAPKGRPPRKEGGG